MTRLTPKVLLSLAAFSFATPIAGQSAMTPAQCDTMMMAGTQNYSVAAVTSCTTYFQTLARNAAAPGVFSASSGAGASVNVSTSGTGG